ncbi:hypothetical protein H4S02_002851, partial [Coemansia sp. RSA 2611]
MNATDVMQPPLSPASPTTPGQPSLVRFRHSCEHCSGTRPVCDHCLRRSIPCVYKPQAKNPRRGASSQSPLLSGQHKRAGFRNKRPAAGQVQPISIPANSSGYSSYGSPFLQPFPVDMRHASAPIYNGDSSSVYGNSPAGSLHNSSMQNSSMHNSSIHNSSVHLRPASAIPPHLSSHSSMSSGFASPFAFGCSLPSDMGSTPGSSLTPDPNWALQLEGTPDISVNGLFPADQPDFVYDVQALSLESPQTAPAGKPAFATAQQPHGQQQQHLQPSRRAVPGDSPESLSNVPLIEQSAESAAFLGFYADHPQQQQQMSFSMPTFSGPASLAADSSVPMFQADDPTFLDLFSSFATPQPQQQQPQQQPNTRLGSGIAPELTVCQDEPAATTPAR